ncbi:MAG: type II/IV secretion system protein [Elusimicrobia bacterium]|nr:type II/IV secretion system protein [Elusimicrobiota bacterium]
MHQFKDEWLLRSLVGVDRVTAAAVDKLRKEAKPYISGALIQAGLIKPEAVAQAVQKTYGVSYHDPDSAEIDKLAVGLVPEKLCRRHRLMPMRISGESLHVAMVNPIDQTALSDVEATSGRHPVPFYLLDERVEALINEFYKPDALVFALLDKMVGDAPVEVIGGKRDSDSDDVAVTAPVIRLVNGIIAKAVELKASDIHIEHEESVSVVRLRIDGALKNYMTIPRAIAAKPVVSRIKIMADLDVALHMRPQDGRAQLRVGNQEIGLRVSILPTNFGEKVVMRILDQRSAEVPFEKLGLSPELAARMDAILKMTQGIFLVTGPTGSGKTTTLYSMINKIKSEDTNIVTVEDPIEYKLAGINQVQVNEKQGLTFAGVLRSVLRQDPDVILLGEIRDRETADIAFQAALTGHLVFSTLHTNDTLSTITRLSDMGIEPFKLAPGLIAITAQRLVRRLCPACSTPGDPSKIEGAVLDLFRELGIAPANREPAGCPQCDAGYKGRVSIVEFLEVSQVLKNLISVSAVEEQLREAALSKGLMRTMATDALWHVSQGHTSVEEVMPHLNLGRRKERDIPQVAAPAVQAAPAAPAAQAAPQPAPAATHLKRRRVLVVDDDKGVRLILRLTLEKAGFEVKEAEDGVKAMEAVADVAPDAVILDLQMPNLDGQGVIRAMRESLKLWRPLILILTAFAGENTQPETLRLGADDFISKPPQPHIVLAHLNASAVD